MNLAFLLVFLLLNTASYFNIRKKIKAISKERKLRFYAMYKLQKFTRMQVKFLSINAISIFCV